ncbi:MAG: hypothetical protein QOE70_2163 [Chthoniobacter sp.]|jgi:hypothetical protein|nr:hypothetical protein [Chthoniobacter sp.]
MKLLGRLIPTLALVCGLFPATAQETKAPETVRLEDVPAKFTEIDEAITRKVEEVRAIVDREAAAKRISEPIAQSLRWSLRSATTSSGWADSRMLLSTTRVPPENEALAAAVRDLENTHTTSTVRRQTLAVAAMKEGRQRTLEALRSATKAEDLRPLETALEAVREATQRRSISTFPDATTAYGAPNVMRGLRRLLEAQGKGDAVEIGGAISQLRQAATSDRDLSSSPESGAAR